VQGHLNFVDNQGNPVPLDTGVRLSLQASKLTLCDKECDNEKKWTDRLDLDVPIGASASTAVELKSDSWVSDTGTLNVEVRSPSEYLFVVYDQNLEVKFIPRWYVPLMMAMLGGVIHSFYRTGKRYAHYRGGVARFILRNVLPGIATGLLAGFLAYLLANWGVLGIKADTTGLQGYMVLGFLFSYVGVDLILKTVTQREDAKESPKHRRQQVEEHAAQR
jgi:hypothetical protein